MIRMRGTLSAGRFHEAINYRIQAKQKVLCSVAQRVVKPDLTVFDAEVIEPWSPMFGYRATGPDPITAQRRLSDKLASVFGFIGALETKEVIGQRRTL